MKKLIGFLSLIAIFAACKKDTPNTGLGTGCATAPIVTKDYTLNIKFVEDCTMRPRAINGDILWSSDGKAAIPLTKDSVGSYTQKFKRTGGACEIDYYFTSSFKFDSLNLGFAVERWTTNESILFVKNDVVKVDVKFIYNANSAAQLKDSFAILCGDVYWLPVLTKDTAFSVSLKVKNLTYRKENGNFSPIGRVGFEAKKKWLIQQPIVNVTTFGVCGTQSVIIQ
jgi:hypothetical protein